MATKPKATEEQIQQWKNQHKDVYEIEVPLNDEGLETVKGYFKKPDIDDLAVSGKFAKSDPIKSGKLLFDATYLGGDEAFETILEVKMSAIASLGEVFKIRAATVKKK